MTRHGPTTTAPYASTSLEVLAAASQLDAHARRVDAQRQAQETLREVVAVQADMGMTYPQPPVLAVSAREFLWECLRAEWDAGKEWGGAWRDAQRRFSTANGLATNDRAVIKPAPNQHGYILPVLVHEATHLYLFGHSAPTSGATAHEYSEVEAWVLHEGLCEAITVETLKRLEPGVGAVYEDYRYAQAEHVIASRGHLEEWSADSLKDESYGYALVYWHSIIQSSDLTFEDHIRMIEEKGSASSARTPASPRRECSR